MNVRIFRRAAVTGLVVIGLMALSLSAFAQRGEFLSPQDFFNQSLPDGEPSWKTLWVTSAQRTEIENILGRSFAGLRIRYQTQGYRTAWVFEEIGKELPITFGIVVDGESIKDIQVLTYRESRGSEVRYPFFTSQFEGAALVIKNDSYRLTNRIDGITGATLSVRAMKKVAKLALFCHQLTGVTEVNASESTASR